MEKNVYQLVREKIAQADAILMGASNGLSISEGFNLFADDRWFQENFGDFRAKYRIHSVLQGAFFQFPSQEEKWAFWSRLVYRKSVDVQPSRMMLNLYRLVAGKAYYVVTTHFRRNRYLRLRASLLKCAVSAGVMKPCIQIKKQSRAWQKQKRRALSLRRFYPSVRIAAVI